jgi:ribosomal protein L40E
MQTERTDTMSDQKRCPQCGGLNPLGAEWCGQCLARFIAPAPPPPPEPDAVLGELNDLPELEARSGEAPAPVRRGAFIVAGHDVSWTCPLCDNDNPLDAAACEVCGRPFGDLVREAEPERATRDANTAALLSLFMPGAGHYYVGKKGEGVARAILSLWVLGVTFVTGIYGNGALSIAGAIVFGLVAFGLWVVAAHDAFREARGEGGVVILKGRLYLYLVMVLLCLLMVLLVGTALQVRTG